MTIMQLICLYTVWVLFGLLSAYIAKKKGRRAPVWFFLGMSLGILSVLLLIVLPAIQPPPLAPSSAPPLFIPPSGEWAKLWYYLDEAKTQQGPLEFAELIKNWREKKVTEGTYIWGEGMGEWKRLAELPHLLKEFG